MLGDDVPTPQRRRNSTNNNLDVGFSDGRFIQRILEEVQKGSGANDVVVARLVGHGFAPDVAKIALQVCGGDEQKALQLCMTGLSFTGCGSGSNLLTPEKVCAPPAPLACYICGGSYLSEKSLEIHSKACRKRFQQREAKREPRLRRPLLEEHELPEGVSTLEAYYELSDGKAPDPAELAKAAAFDELVARQKQQEANLVPCAHCGRTFAWDRLDKHQRVCQERPKHLDTPAPIMSRPAPARRKSTDSVTGTINAGEKAYETFCQNLATCPCCRRSFKKELLEGHMKQCPIALREAGERRQLKSVSVSAPSTFKRHSAPTANTFAPPARGAGGRAVATPPRPPQKTGSVAASATAPRRSSIASAVARVSTASSQASSEHSCSVLLAKDFVVRASLEDEVALRAEVLASVPNAEFMGAYQVKAGAQDRIYDAIKGGMQASSSDSSEAGAPQELQLWHGTSWAILAQILRHGFNRSFAGRHGTKLGVATYFSSGLAYSARFCDKQGGGADGTKVVLLSSVLVGKYCKGSPSDVEPPIMDADTGERYDSTVDNEDNPSIFAVFRDFQALPQFLVEFR